MTVQLAPGLYRLKGGRSATGKMRVLGPKRFVLLAGSEARESTTDSCPPGIRTARAELLKAGVLVNDGQRLLLAQDHEVKSSSQAEGILMGSAPRGRGRGMWELIPEAAASVGESKPQTKRTSRRAKSKAAATRVTKAANNYQAPSSTMQADDPMVHFIDSTVVTFQREQRRYADLAEMVRVKMSELTKGMLVSIQFRVKQPESLRKKLTKYCSDEPSGEESSALRTHLMTIAQSLMNENSTPLGKGPHRPWPSVQETTLDTIPDLAGVRVLFYRKSDMDYLIKLIEGNEKADAPFATYEEGRAHDDDPENLYLDGKVLAKRTGSYAATHVRLIYMGSKNDPLSGARCEVQITTVADHLINEVSHEVDYKRKTTLDDRQSGAIMGALEALQENMLSVQKSVDKLFVSAGIPKARMAAVDEFWELEPGHTRAERVRSADVRKWLALLADYANSGADEADREASRLLASKQQLKRQLDLDKDELLRLVRTYNRLYEPIGSRGDARGRRQLDPDRESDLWLIYVLNTLPEPFLDSFAQDKGMRVKTPGKPALIVDIADAFLEARHKAQNI